MITKGMEIEGTWEEIVNLADDLAGCRVRVTVLAEQSQLNSSEKPVNFHPASGHSLLRHAGIWSGDDLEECLQMVYEDRRPLKF
jgi:hypothetical protein